MKSESRIFVALDVNHIGHALKLVGQLKGQVAGFKVGLELIHSAGPGIVANLRTAGADRIFYDAKLHDIPKTVAGAVRAIARLGVEMVTVHAGGGSEMLKAACRAAQGETDGEKPANLKVIAVTLLTSIGGGSLRQELMVDYPVDDYVMNFAGMAQAAGCYGIVCSPLEVRRMRKELGPDICLITPGVRSVEAKAHDQVRTATAGEAMQNGASYVVVGRPITQADDPVVAAESINREIASALGSTGCNR